MHRVNLIRTNCAFADASENVWCSSNTIIWIYHFFTRNNLFFPIDFDVIFPMQSSEFIKSANFVSNLKKTEEKKRKNYIFNLKIDFYRWKNIFLI